MTGPIYLSLVFHNHQPVGQLDHVTEHSTHVSYLPLVEALERFPRIKVAMHYSGTLLDWLKQNYAEMIERLGALVARGQIEMLSGGYYEPALCVIPDEDKIGQIEKLSAELDETLGSKASGMWLAERIWEPHLARPIAQAGLRYTIVDDTAFEMAGFDIERDLFGYYITEEEGHAVALFPTQTALRHAIPWEPVETLLEWLRERAVQPDRLALMGDNGEKFGTWPGSYEHCWGDGKYIDELFTTLLLNEEWLRTTTPGEYMAGHGPLGRAYLPTASYQEMGIWSMPPQEGARLAELRRKYERERRSDVTRFLHGGLWRNFMVKYDEINHLHKRVVMVSRKVHAMRRGRKRERALDLLWAAQGHTPYWHGLYGGVYLFNVRVANYANLLAAETAADTEDARMSLERLDFDCDGYEDIVVSGSPLNAIWSPARGGPLLELDFRPAPYNLYNVMTRRRETYHADLVRAAAENRIVTPQSNEAESPRMVRAKEPGLERLLIYDWHRRASFLDHILGPSTTLDEFYRAHYAEQGDFIDQPYKVVEAVCDGVMARVTLRRDGHVWIGEMRRPLTVQKTFNLHEGNPAVEVVYTLVQEGESPIDLRFGVETVVGFDAGGDLRYASVRINDGERLSLNGLREVEAVTQYCADTNLHNLTLRTELGRPAFLWQFPLETITLSEVGFERGYQGTVFLHLWHIRLESGERWEVTITQSVQQMATRP